MTRLQKLAVEHFRTKRIPNPSPSGELPWGLYQTVRNCLVRTCRRHGPTGPLGEFPLETDSHDISDWGRGDDKHMYWIVDDQYNDEMYLYLEFVDASACSPQWLQDVTAALRSFPGWGIGVNGLPKGYLLIFANRLLVKGPLFRGCRDAANVIDAIRKQR